MAEHPEGFRHVGLLVARPPAGGGLPFKQSSDNSNPYCRVQNGKGKALTCRLGTGRQSQSSPGPRFLGRPAKAYQRDAAGFSGCLGSTGTLHKRAVSPHVVSAVRPSGLKATPTDSWTAFTSG